MIIIKVDSNILLTSDSLNIKIDNTQVGYKITNGEIVIECDVTFGFHFLKIQTNFAFDSVEDKIQITDVLVNGASIRQMMYLGFYPGETRRYTTIINHKDSEWHLPFGNPVSWWMSECMVKIPNKSYGSDLNESLEILYPGSIDLPDNFPQVIKDFFKFNFGFTAYNKEELKTPLHNLNIPYLPVSIEYDEQALYKEFMDNLEYLQSEKYVPGQNKYNEHEINNYSKPWYIDLAVVDSKITVAQQQFPEFYKLVNSIKGVDVKLSFIGTLYPNSYIAPHVDDLYKHVDYMGGVKGLSQIFIPIGWTENNYFKASGVGLIPYQQGALLFANSRIPHASVNCSDIIRFTIGLMCEFKGTDFLQYVN